MIEVVIIINNQKPIKPITLHLLRHNLWDIVIQQYKLLS